MKTIWQSILFAFLTTTGFGVDAPRIVANPIADYTARHRDDLRTENETNERMIKIEIDIDNNGSKDLFLSCEKSCLYDDTQYENKVYMWDLYKKLGDGRYAVVETQLFKITNGQSELLKSQFDFDPDKFYVGYIAEVQAYGILAIRYLPRRNEVELCAYILRGDYFEQLNFPDPARPVGKYHRDEAGNIPDLPESVRAYFAAPPTEKITVLP